MNSSYIVPSQYAYIWFSNANSNKVVVKCENREIKKSKMSSHKEPQCVRCGHLAIAGSEEGFLETPCSHLYCSKCVHRYDLLCCLF